MISIFGQNGDKSREFVFTRFKDETDSTIIDRMVFIRLYGLDQRYTEVILHKTAFAALAFVTAKPLKNQSLADLNMDDLTSGSALDAKNLPALEMQRSTF